jgi:FMN phosphatase YigB (HAD superfamily)
VGDSRRRDVLCARRADATAILMRSSRTDEEDPAGWPSPDATVTDGFGLAELLTQAL